MESTYTETLIRQLVQWLRLSVEATGAVIVGLGFVVAGWLFLRAVIAGRTANFNAIRLTLARYLALALEFQLGADILSTAIAPGWQEIGKLGAIAVIRTGLNYYLSMEMRSERDVRQTEGAVTDASASPNLAPQDSAPGLIQ